MKNNEKGFANIILIGVIVILLGVGGYFIWSKKTNKNLKNTDSTTIYQEVKNSESKTQTPIVKDETINWKTYTNNQYGFEFGYPKSWILKDIDQSNENYDISVGYISPAQNAVRGPTYCESYSNNAHGRCEVYKRFIIDWEFGVSAMINNANGGTVGISLKKINAENKKIFQKILSTFKFTK